MHAQIPALLGENGVTHQISVLSAESSLFQACGVLDWEGLSQDHSHPSLACGTQQILCSSLHSRPGKQAHGGHALGDIVWPLPTRELFLGARMVDGAGWGLVPGALVSLSPEELSR